MVILSNINNGPILWKFKWINKKRGKKEDMATVDMANWIFIWINKPYSNHFHKRDHW